MTKEGRDAIHVKGVKGLKERWKVLRKRLFKTEKEMGNFLSTKIG